jgi:hypothetical protein
MRFQIQICNASIHPPWYSHTTREYTNSKKSIMDRTSSIPDPDVAVTVARCAANAAADLLLSMDAKLNGITDLHPFRPSCAPPCRIDHSKCVGSFVMRRIALTMCAAIPVFLNDRQPLKK